MAVTRYAFNSNEFKISYQQQVTWGTSLGASPAAAQILSYETGVLEDDGIDYRTFMRANVQRSETQADASTSSTLGVPKITISGVAGYNEIHFGLFWALQACSQSGAATYIKTFTSAQTPMVIGLTNTMSTVNGFGGNIYLNPPVSTKGFFYQDAIVSKFSLSGSRQNGEPLKYSMTFAGFTPAYNQTIAGTHAACNTISVPMGTMVLTDATNPIPYTDFNLDITPNYEAIPGNYGWKMPVPEYKLSATVLYNAYVADWLNSRQAKTAFVMYLGNTGTTGALAAATATGHLRFILNALISDVVDVSANEIKITFDCKDVTAGGNRDITGSFCDSINRTVA